MCTSIQTDKLSSRQKKNVLFYGELPKILTSIILRYKEELVWLFNNGVVSVTWIEWID